MNAPINPDPTQALYEQRIQDLEARLALIDEITADHESRLEDLERKDDE